MSRRREKEGSKGGSGLGPLLAGVAAGVAVVATALMIDSATEAGAEDRKREDKKKPRVVLDTRCPICVERYDDNKHAPYAFDCGHTACRGCSLEMDKCHHCRAAIQHRLRLYLN